jgi:hypothetical protein
MPTWRLTRSNHERDPRHIKKTGLRWDTLSGQVAVRARHRAALGAVDFGSLLRPRPLLRRPVWRGRSTHGRLSRLDAGYGYAGDTRLLLGWIIHFIQDVLIFSFMAVGSITTGGG